MVVLVLAAFIGCEDKADAGQAYRTGPPFFAITSPHPVPTGAHFRPITSAP